MKNKKMLALNSVHKTYTFVIYVVVTTDITVATSLVFNSLTKSSNGLGQG